MLETSIATGDSKEDNPFTQIDARLTPDGLEVFKGRHPGDWNLETMGIPVELVRNDDTNNARFDSCFRGTNRWLWPPLR